MLLAVWSASAFLLEVPSGAWADLVDRRRLLLVSGLVYAAAFVTWLLAPTFWGFLLGFVLWSLSDAMQSGTWEAYLYDQLAAQERAEDYGRVKARAESAALVVMAGAIALAAPLHQLGGYPLVGWVSVVVVGLHVLATLALPRPARHRPGRAHPGPGRPRTVTQHVTALPTGGAAVAGEGSTSGRAWLATLRAGVRHARAAGPVRRVLLGYAAVVTLVGFDEYFPLVLADDGISVGSVAVVMAALVLLEAALTWSADRVARLTGWRHAGWVAAAGLLLAGGTWWSGWAAAAALATGYALASTAYVAADVRLQHAMGPTTRTRATITSVASLAAEVGFLVTLAAVGLATLHLDLTTVISVTALVLVVPASVAAWRMPPAP